MLKKCCLYFAGKKCAMEYLLENKPKVFILLHGNVYILVMRNTKVDYLNIVTGTFILYNILC